MYDFIENKDSTFFLVGYTNNFYGFPNTKKALLMHVDKYGDTLWTRKYNAGFLDLAPFNDSSFIISGGFPGSSGASAGLIKMNNSGDTLLYNLYYSSVCTGGFGNIEQCPDKGFILENNGACDYGYLKVDSNLNVQWHQWQSMIFGAWKLRPDPLGGYVSVGNGGTNWPYAVERLDSAGNQVWYQTHGTMASNPSNTYYASDVVVTSDSNYLVGCWGTDIQMMKVYRVTGTQLWTKQYSSSGASYVYSMDYAGNDTYICAGDKFFLIDSSGNKLWEHDYVLPGHHIFTIHVAKTLDGGFALGGSFRNSNLTYRIIFFIKTDSLGNTAWSSIYNMEGVPLTIYPNPASDFVYISTGTFANAHDITFTLYDMQGTIRMQEYYNGSAVNISHIPPGFYAATLSSNGKTIRAKVVVER